MLWRNLSLFFSLLPLALVINLQKFFFMPKPVQGLVLLLLLVAAGDGQAAVIESIDAFATRIS